VNEVFEGVRVFLCLAFLTYASWSDFKKREVSNTVWAIFAPLALALTSLQLLMFAPHLLYVYALSFVVTSAFSIAIFYAGAFGGADAKALICLALAIPTYPAHLLQPLSGFISPLSFLLFPIATFCNAVLLASLSVFYAILRNFLWKRRTRMRLFEGFEKESKWRKLLTFLCGYKVETAELEKGKHLYSLEDIHVVDVGESERKLLVMPQDEESVEIVERILNAARQGKIPNEVWVTPGLPLLVFVTAGLIVALAFGDVVWIILRSALGQGSWQ